MSAIADPFGCNPKPRWDFEADAIAALRTVSATGWPYLCGRCGYWHLPRRANRLLEAQ